MLLVALSLLMCCSLVSNVFAKALSPSLAVMVTPTIRPGICLVSLLSNCIARIPNNGPPKFNGPPPIVWPSPIHISAPYSPGGFISANEFISAPITTLTPFS